MRSKTFKSGSQPKMAMKTISGKGAGFRSPMPSAGFSVGKLGKTPDKAVVKGKQ